MERSALRLVQRDAHRSELNPNGLASGDAQADAQHTALSNGHITNATATLANVREGARLGRGHLYDARLATDVAGRCMHASA